MIGSRTLRVLMSAGVSSLARFMGMIFTLLITPMIYRTLGPEEFGLWSVATQLITFAAFADLGLGNGLLTRLNQTQNERSRESLIASAFALLSLIALSLLLIGETGLVLYQYNSVVIDNWLGISHSIESVRILQSFILIFCLILPFSIVQKVQFSNFDNATFHIWETADKSLALIGALVAILFNSPLYLLFSAFYLPTLCTNALNFFIYQKGQLRRTALSYKNISKDYLRDLFIIGRSFFVLNTIYSISRGTDTMLIAGIADLATVSRYQLPLRLFDLILVVTMLFSSPLWSGYANAFNSKDTRWIKKTLIQSIAASSLLCLIAGGVLAGLGNEILSAWTKTNISNTSLLYYGLFFWTLVSTQVNVLSAYLNARAKIRAQMFMFLTFAVIGIPLKIIGYQFANLAGFVFANSLAQLFCILLPSIVVVYRDFQTFKQENMPPCATPA